MIPVMNTISGNLGPDASEEMESLALPSIDRLRELLQYDEDTGLFVWKQSVVSGRYGRRINAMHGDVAGWITGAGYRTISIDGRQHMAHRLALYMHGGVSKFEWPQKHVDHINGDKLDNRLANLR